MDTNAGFKRMKVFIIACLVIASCTVVILPMNSGTWAKVLSCYELVCDRQAARDLVKSAGFVCGRRIWHT